MQCFLLLSSSWSSSSNSYLSFLVTSSPTMKFDVRPTNLYLRKLSRHGVKVKRIARMDDNVDADAKQILTTSPSVCIGSDHQDDRGWPGWRRCRTTSTPTGCHGPTQSTWPRTDHSGGCWRPVALRTRSGASRRRRRSSTLLTLVRVCSGCAYLGQLTVPGLCHGVIKGLLSWITETVNDDSIQKNQIS